MIKDKVSILHLYSSFTPGGAERVMLALAKGLESNGFKNFIGAPSKSFMNVKAAELGLSALTVFLKGSLDIFGISRLLYLCFRYDIDIIHAHQGKVFWPSVFTKWLRFGRTKLVFHRHAQIPHKFYSRLHYLWADKVIAISKAVAQGLEEKESVPKEKLAVVYNGTDFSKFSASVSAQGVREKHALGDSIVIGTVGAMNLPKGKGQGTLIEAAEMLSASFPDLKYLIVGQGPLKVALEEKAAAGSAKDKIIFAGQQEAVERYIAAMDIFCLLSWDSEGFGQVVVEAQAMGKPVIATNIGGIPEALKDGVSGFIIPPENPASLCEKIKLLIQSKDKRDAIGKAAEEFAKKHFSMEVMINSITDIYRNILEKEKTNG